MVTSFVTGSVIPPARRGTVWPGLAHSSDWYPTLLAVAGGALPVNTGPRPPDGVNLWPALVSGGPSPRTEVIHQVVNNLTLAQGLTDPATIRVGRFKLFLNGQVRGPVLEIFPSGPFPLCPQPWHGENVPEQMGWSTGRIDIRVAHAAAGRRARPTPAR